MSLSVLQQELLGCSASSLAIAGLLVLLGHSVHRKHVKI